MGMPFHEYWEGPCWLVRAYREAAQIKRDLTNHEQWRLCLYVYDTLLRVAPLYDPWGKSRKAIPYVDAPYPLTEEQAKTQTVSKEDRELDKVKAYMEVFAAENNKRFEREEVE